MVANLRKDFRRMYSGKRLNISGQITFPLLDRKPLYHVTVLPKPVLSNLVDLVRQESPETLNPSGKTGLIYYSSK